MTFDGIEFESMAKPDVDELLAFYERQHHPIPGGREKLRKMMENTFCLVVARCHGELIGLARGVTDGLWGRLVDCKLDPAYQGPACITRTDGRVEHDAAGIAKRMAMLVMKSLRDFGVQRIDVIAHGTEVDFCEELGFRKVRGGVAMSVGVESLLCEQGVASAAAR